MSPTAPARLSTLCASSMYTDASRRLSSGMRARPVAACQTLAKTKLPMSFAVSSPIWPLGSRAMRMPPSRTVFMSKLEFATPRVCRTKSRNKKARSLASTGPMIWARSGGGVLSYHSQNPSRPSGSSRPTVNAARNCLSLSSGGTRVSVALAWRIRVRHATRSTSSMRGPQCRWKIFEKIDTMLSTTRSSSKPDSGLRVAPPFLVGVDQDEAVGDGGRQPVQDVQRQVTLRVDDDHAAVGFDVVDDHVGHLGGLP